MPNLYRCNLYEVQQRHWLKSDGNYINLKKNCSNILTSVWAIFYDSLNSEKHCIASYIFVSNNRKLLANIHS